MELAWLYLPYASCPPRRWLLVWGDERELNSQAPGPQPSGATVRLSPHHHTVRRQGIEPRSVANQATVLPLNERRVLLGPGDWDRTSDFLSPRQARFHCATPGCWSGRLGSNQRSSGPKPDAMPLRYAPLVLLFLRRLALLHSLQKRIPFGCDGGYFMPVFFSSNTCPRTQCVCAAL